MKTGEAYPATLNPFDPHAAVANAAENAIIEDGLATRWSILNVTESIGRGQTQTTRKYTYEKGPFSICFTPGTRPMASVILRFVTEVDCVGKTETQCNTALNQSLAKALQYLCDASPDFAETIRNFTAKEAA